MPSGKTPSKEPPEPVKTRRRGQDSFQHVRGVLQVFRTKLVRDDYPDELMIQLEICLAVMKDRFAKAADKMKAWEVVRKDVTAWRTALERAGGEAESADAAKASGISSIIRTLKAGNE